MVAGARGTGDARGTVGGLVAGGLATYVDAEDGAGGRPRQARYRVEAACTAQGLLAALVRSKPAVARAFEAGALAMRAMGDHPDARLRAVGLGEEAAITISAAWRDSDHVWSVILAFYELLATELAGGESAMLGLEEA